MLASLNAEISLCRRCPRLVAHREQVAKEKRRAYLDWDYWGRPVPGFGDPRARLLIIGLAPGAHGANRTGRMFTGDRSGDFLYRALHETGFASQPHAVSREDGMVLRDAYITAAVRCAPPDNKPTIEEFRTCRAYLDADLGYLDRVGVVVALGALAFKTYLSVLKDRHGPAYFKKSGFRHKGVHRTGECDPLLISSYHPSQQNTSTGRLTLGMLVEVFQRARTALGE